MEKLIDDIRKFKDMYQEKMKSSVTTYYDKDYLGCWADCEITKINIAIIYKLQELEERISKLEDN